MSVFDWKCEVEHAGWKPRDSEGYFVFKDKMWVLGGWEGTSIPLFRDVWCSANGRDWELLLEEAPWIHSDIPMAVVHKDAMWMMGGWYGGRTDKACCGDQVWRSEDGVAWDLVCERTEWEGRMGAGIVSFAGKMWIIGGTKNYLLGDDSDLLNEVWCSEDGTNWQCVNAAAPFSPRAFHQCLVFDDKIWVFGGGTYVPTHHAKNDVWCSSDGVNWEEVTSDAAWGKRIWFTSAVYRDHMWVMGGWTKEVDNYADAWYSKDGVNWKAIESNDIWKATHAHATYVLDDKLWVCGGHARPLNNQMWSLELPVDWKGD